jgi:hypothetical protein
LILGIDFDNTIVSYDEVMRSIARDWNLVDARLTRKKQIRDAIRRLADGELRWQQLQAAAYGTRIREAVPCPGVREFLMDCKRSSIPVRIVSHKTERPNLPGAVVDLRDAALGWLEQQGFFADGSAVSRADVYFEPTRARKLARIAELGVTHFIDDLEETFAEPLFPAGVARILYTSESSAPISGVTVLPTWQDIRHHLLEKRAEGIAR